MQTIKAFDRKFFVSSCQTISSPQSIELEMVEMRFVLRLLKLEHGFDTHRSILICREIQRSHYQDLYEADIARTGIPS